MKAQDPYTFDHQAKLWRDARPAEARDASSAPTATGLDEPFFFDLRLLREGPPEEVVTARGDGALEAYPLFEEPDEETTKVVVPQVGKSRPSPGAGELTPAKGPPRRFLGTPVRTAVAAAASASLMAAVALAFIAPAAHKRPAVRASAVAAVPPVAARGAVPAPSATVSPQAAWPLSPIAVVPEPVVVSKSPPARVSAPAAAAPSPARRDAAPASLSTPSELAAREGDGALQRGAADDAKRAYRASLAVNPSYVPARVGLADATWLSGDRAGAAALYAKIAAEVPSHLVPARARERGDAVTAPKTVAASPPAPAASEEWVPTAP